MTRGCQTTHSARLFTCVAVAVLAIQLVPDFVASDLDSDVAFAVPATTGHALDIEEGTRKAFVQGAYERNGLRGGRTIAQAAPVAPGLVGIGAKIANAMGAGAVASVIQAALSAVGEPIVNRVLVKRMAVMDAIKEVKPAMMLEYFKTTLTTNFLKFPFFEAINALCAALPISPSVRGFITGVVFTTATLPVTNYRYRKSMQMEVNWSNIYEAYWPTLVRDIVYGIARNYSTIWLLAANPAWKSTTPTVLFIVVIWGCVASAPFNEIRGFLLQSKGNKMTWQEFFNPMNCVRSTSLGAFKQGLALAVGYWCAPPVQKFVSGLIAGLRG